MRESNDFLLTKIKLTGRLKLTYGTVNYDTAVDSAVEHSTGSLTKLGTSPLWATGNVALLIKKIWAWVNQMKTLRGSGAETTLLMVDI